MTEDLLAQMLRNLSTDKENIDMTDDSTLIQKMLAPNEETLADDGSTKFIKAALKPNDYVTNVDSINYTKKYPAVCVWGGYLSATYYSPNWTWNVGGVYI